MARRSNAVKKLALVEPAPIIKLDIGCGIRKREGFRGVDILPLAGVDYVADVRKTPWQWADESVTEVHASHFVEHLTQLERVSFANEVYRILVPGGTVQIITPHWTSCRAYGDPTHLWPPVSEFWAYYLSREWRQREAPHTDGQHVPGMYNCNFVVTWGYSLHPQLHVKAEQVRQFAIENYVEARQDMTMHWTKA